MKEELKPIADTLNGLLTHKGQFDSETCKEALRLIIGGSQLWKE